MKKTILAIFILVFCFGSLFSQNTPFNGMQNSLGNLYMLSKKGLYRVSEKSFLMYESTPVAVGTREGYDFAITAEKLKFFRDSRDIKFYNNVSGWLKNVDEAAPKKKR